MVEGKEKVGKYPLAVRWNTFIRCLREAEREWKELQEELDGMSGRELEMKYPVAAQKHLTKFRRVNFEWMLPMLVDYYRGAGGLREMHIVLPPSENIKEKGEKS